MKKKISWIELIIILCVVIFFVSGWKFWYKPDKNFEITPVPSAVSIEDPLPVPIKIAKGIKIDPKTAVSIEDPLPVPIDMDKEYNLSPETIEIKYFLKDYPDEPEPYKRQTLKASNNFAPPSDILLIPRPTIIKAIAFDVDKNILIEVQQEKDMHVDKENIDLHLKNYRFVLETYPDKIISGKKSFIIVRLISGDPLNPLKPTDNVKIDFSISSGDCTLLEKSKVTNSNGVCAVSFIANKPDCIYVRGEFSVKDNIYSNTCNFQVTE